MVAFLVNGSSSGRDGAEEGPAFCTLCCFLLVVLDSWIPELQMEEVRLAGQDRRRDLIGIGEKTDKPGSFV